MNSVGDFFYKGKLLDVDWWMTINGFTWQQPNRAFLVYGVGKTYWFLAKKLTNLVLSLAGSSGFAGTTAPFEDPGERLAVVFASQRYRYADIFTESWMKANCAGK